MATTGEEDDVILKVNQVIHNPDKKRLLMPTFQSCWSVTRVDNTPIQHNASSMFGLVFHNNDTDDTFIIFKLHGLDVRFNIRTPTDEDMVIFTIYEVTIQILWDPQDPIYANN